MEEQLSCWERYGFDSCLWWPYLCHPRVSLHYNFKQWFKLLQLRAFQRVRGYTFWRLVVTIQYLPKPNSNFELNYSQTWLEPDRICRNRNSPKFRIELLKLIFKSRPNILQLLFYTDMIWLEAYTSIYDTKQGQKAKVQYKYIWSDF